MDGKRVKKWIEKKRKKGKTAAIVIALLGMMTFTSCSKMPAETMPTTGDNICLKASAAAVCAAAGLSAYATAALISADKIYVKGRKLMAEPDIEYANKIREMFPKGTRVRLEYIKRSNEKHGLHFGDTGTVIGVDDFGNIHVSWDNFSNTILNSREDFFRKDEA